MKNVLVVGSASVTGLNVVRALRDRKDIKLLGTDVVADNPANEICNNFVIPRAEDRKYPIVMHKLLEKERVTHVIVCDDHDLRVLYELRDDLFDTSVTVNGFSTYTWDFLDKRKTIELFNKHEVLVPREALLHEYPNVVRNLLAGCGPKFVEISSLDPRCRTSVEQESSNFERKEKFDGLSKHWICTQYVKGKEYTIDVLCSPEHEPLAIVPRLRKKIKNGLVHHAEITNDPVLIEKTKKLVSKCQLAGINCVQCIVSEDDGKAYFTEVNSRPGSGMDLTINAGVNLVSLWLDGVTDNIPTPRWGAQMVRNHGAWYF